MSNWWLATAVIATSVTTVLTLVWNNYYNVLYNDCCNQWSNTCDDNGDSHWLAVVRKLIITTSTTNAITTVIIILIVTAASTHVLTDGVATVVTIIGTNRTPPPEQCHYGSTSVPKQSYNTHPQLVYIVCLWGVLSVLIWNVQASSHNSEYRHCQFSIALCKLQNDWLWPSYEHVAV